MAAATRRTTDSSTASGSWDSWKIASGNVHFNEEIAKSEMITLFDYQADNGMVPDFISYNKKYNNWRDAKPP